MDLSLIDKLFEEAKEHHKTHKCGGAPYKSYRELFEFLEQPSPARFAHTLSKGEGCSSPKVSFEDFSKIKILEIGTATGLMTFFFSQLFPNAKIDSLEIEKEHVEIAKKLLKQPSPNKLQIINCDALSYMQYCPANTYEIIFFDGFSPDLEFLNQYERILKKDGILISANSHLSQSKTREYFKKLSNEKNWKKLTSFEDTIIYQKLF
jgi:protein-L-isoaspartate O-methyltransferase